MTKIKNCPNPTCGSSNMKVVPAFAGAYYFVECSDCYMYGPPGVNGDAAVDLWNSLCTPPDCDDGWISVKDELPKAGRAVLLCVKGERRAVVGYIDMRDGLWVVHGESITYNPTDDFVTHWQPLPSLPNLPTNEPTTPEMDVQQAVDDVIESLARLPDAIARVGEEVKETVRKMLDERRGESVQ